MSDLIVQDTKVSCYHCGNDCNEQDIVVSDKHFCCNGCLTVFEILEDNQLCGYYDLNQNAGVSLKAKSFKGKFDYLNEKSVVNEILDYEDEDLAKVIFHIPSIHCSSCVWLLENFHKIRSGVYSSRLNFVKKELAIDFDPKEVNLKEIVELLATLGYEPNINLDSSTKKKKIDPETHRLLLKIGVVGFCSGNIMLLSFPEYFSLNLENVVDAGYQRFFLYLNFLLAIPVFLYGAEDYLKGAYRSIKEKISDKSSVLSVDIPIAMGVVALFVRSTYETFIPHTAGYWDSLAGLVLFLLLGKWVQQTTFSYLSFDRNYKSYFPLAVKMKDDSFKNVKDLRKGDSYVTHHQELVPADSILISGNAWLDYSFVTGESTPVRKHQGDLIYAGGRQMSEQISLEVIKPVSTSYLTQLWNNESFIKEKNLKTTALAYAFSKYFTIVTITISALAGIYWQLHDPSLVWPTITAVLMVACPCALTLSLPFTMSTTMSIFGKNKFFVKNQQVIPLLTEIDSIVFDKTGTLTESGKEKILFKGTALSISQKKMIFGLCNASVHPLSKAIAKYLNGVGKVEVDYFFEVKGKGIEGIVNQNNIKIGSADFLDIQDNSPKETKVFVAINGELLGYFSLVAVFRNKWEQLLTTLKSSFNIHLLTGDSDQSKAVLKPYFADNMQFEQKPQQKLDYVRTLKSEGHKVLMVGDGLNDAGALREAQVGIALTEDVQAFSPACDAILDAKEFVNIGKYIDFSKQAIKIVKISFLLSVVYNIMGISWAVTGNLSPVVAAIFMPLSSMSVVLFAVGLTLLLAKTKKMI
jgi:P-type Cu+ transporter